MSDTTMAPQQGDEWFGHPKGLFYCFFAEMWERFCFYGMRNILVLYMISYLAYEKDYAQAGPYAAYTSLIYCVAIFGGFVADKYLGYHKSIMMGGFLMAAGMIMLLFNRDITSWIGMDMSTGVEEFFFYAGLATVIVGNGYFKPNISTIVGKLYPEGDPRRDGGFTIFYMGINVGALLGGFVCAEIGERVSWTLGFGIAALGMLLGVFTFGTHKAKLSMKGHGDPASPEAAKRSFPWIFAASIGLIPVFYYLLQNSQIVGYLLGITGVVMVAMMLNVAFKESKKQREMIFALLVLVAFNPIFWAMFEQAGSSLTLYAAEHLNRSVFGMFELAAGSVQQFNALFIIGLAPVFAAMWIKLGKKGKDPSIPMKFTLGLFQLGLGFLLLVIGAQFFTAADGKTPLVFMAGLYLLLTMGELCLSPVGLSMVTKLAPQRMTGMVMGLWFLSIAAANFLAGQIGALTGAEGGAEAAATMSPTEKIGTYTDIYMMSFWVIMGATLFLLCLVPLLKKWTHGVK